MCPRDKRIFDFKTALQAGQCFLIHRAEFSLALAANRARKVSEATLTWSGLLMAKTVAHPTGFSMKTLAQATLAATVISGQGCEYFSSALIIVVKRIPISRAALTILRIWVSPRIQ